MVEASIDVVQLKWKTFAEFLISFKTLSSLETKTFSKCLKNFLKR